MTFADDRGVIGALADVQAAGQHAALLRLDYVTEPAVEHLRNAQQVLRTLKQLFLDHHLPELHRLADAADARVQQALTQIARGNIGSTPHA